MKIAALNIERVSPHAVNHPHPENPRKRVRPGSPAWNTLKATMTKGYYGLIVFNRHNSKLVAGHVRVPILIEMGVEWVDVCMVDLDEDQHRALMIGLNAHSGSDDKDKLATLIESLRQRDFDPCLALIQKLKSKPVNLDMLKPSAKVSRTVEAGQMWRIGNHRIICASCDDHESVRRVAPGGWHVAVIDPPFERDDLPHLTDPSIVFGQAKHIRMIPDHLFRFERVIDKGKAHRSATVQIGHRHAFVVQCGTEKTLPKVSDTFPSIVVCEDRPDHRHQKAVGLLIEHLTHWTPAWSIAFDPFSGSGTTIMAAQIMGRTACAMEIDPGNVSITLQRFQDSFGIEPVLEYDPGDP